MVRICIWVALIVFTLSALFFYIDFSKRTARQYESSLAACQNELEITANAIDVTLGNLAQVMNAEIRKEACISAMIVPGNNNISRTQVITSNLLNTCNSYSLIDRALLYIPTDDSIYSSELSLMPLDQSANRIYVDSYNEKEAAVIVRNEKGGNISVLCTEDTVLMYRPFFASHLKQIGLLVFVIDSGRFYERFGGMNFYNGGELIVTDRTGKKVLPTGGEVPEITPLSNGGPVYGTLSDAIAFRYAAENDGLVYLGIVPRNRLPLSGASNILVVIGVFLVAVLVVSGVIRLYHPIRALVMNVQKRSGGNDPVRDEIAFLNEAYESTARENDRYSHLIENIRPAMIERIFSDILIDRSITEEEIRSVLADIGSPVSYDGHYAVLDVSVQKGDETDPTAVEMNMYLLKMRDLAGKIVPKNVTCGILQMSARSLAMVLAFLPEESDDFVRETISGVGGEIARCIAEPPGRTTVGYGNVYRYITDLPYSYNEATEDRERRFFYGEENNGEEGGSTGERAYCSEQIRRILICINEDRFEQAATKAKQTCLSAVSDSSGAERRLRMLVDLFIDGIVAQRLLSVEDLFAERGELEKNFRNFNSIAQMEQYVSSFFVKTVYLMEQRFKTKRFRNILRIREYVDENYADRNMSLAAAAAHAGISTAYASRLFKEEMDMPFVDYLNGVRVEHAKYLLQNADMPVQDIGFRVGFNTIQTFFRVFKKHTGTPPGSWRGQ